MNRHQLLSIAVWTVCCSCASPMINFKTNEAIQLSAEQPAGGVPKKLGTLPGSQPVSEIKNRVLRFSAEGMEEQRWYFLDSAADQIDVTIQLQKANAQKDLSRKLNNEAARNLLLAYRAVFTKQYARALSLADNLARAYPELAAPFLIKGLAYIRQKNRSAALSELEKAKVLDPDDGSIDILIESVR